ncbi:hypothetical protein NTD84_11000 [Pseudomonas sp. 14P_8.1_Bac3]|uniref:hypothetical protein n=1 Tax=Pseudomonas sp. 14P_8.1_Bac3 TaxID=2971621 RepID=UPI0021C9E90D|nr:hypothetical protein [Pseudomonas sp. 14P_8.1_Bac3]MCU1760237.1 hypothetical protein [Pseudomonas sp. 14P_8.1_Bac3]
MKIKSHPGYYVPLLILGLLVLIVLVSAPPESASTRACKQYASCVAMNAGVPSLLNLR